MTKRVCLVGPVYPYRGGIAHHTSVLANEFSSDHDVLVITFKRLYPSFLFPGKTQFDESGEPISVPSRRTIDSINPISFWRTARTIARFEPDLVVFQWWQPFFAFAYATILWFLRRSSTAKVVFLCHNVLPHESSPVDRFLIKMVFHNVRYFLVHSKEDHRNLMMLNKDAVAQVHPLPIFDMFASGAHTRESARSDLGLGGRVILFFGLIRAYKGLGILLEAFAEVLGRMDATLLVVGEFYEDRDGYLERMKELRIDHKVKVVDRYVPNEEVEKYFAASDVVALPYRSATQSAIVQTAYGFDKPVIVTAVGGLPDVVDDGETGFVVPPEDPAALADAIVRFFDENRGPAMEKAIAGAKARFSWERCKTLLLELGD